MNSCPYLTDNSSLITDVQSATTILSGSSPAPQPEQSQLTKRQKEDNFLSSPLCSSLLLELPPSPNNALPLGSTPTLLPPPPICTTPPSSSLSRKRRSEVLVFDPADWLETLTSGLHPLTPPAAPFLESDFGLDSDLNVNRVLDLMVEQWWGRGVVVCLYVCVANWMHDWKLTTFQIVYPREATPHPLIRSSVFASIHLCQLMWPNRSYWCWLLTSTPRNVERKREREKEICFGNSFRKSHKEPVHIRHTFTMTCIFIKALKMKKKKRIYYTKKRVSPLICLLLQRQTNCRHVATAWSSGSFKQSVCIYREVYALPVCVSTLLLAALSACVCVFVLAHTHLPACSVSTISMQHKWGA